MFKNSYINKNSNPIITFGTLRSHFHLVALRGCFESIAWGIMIFTKCTGFPIFPFHPRWNYTM